MTTPEEMADKIRYFRPTSTVGVFEMTGCANAEETAKVLCDLERKIEILNEHYMPIMLHELDRTVAEGSPTRDIRVVKENDTKWREGYLEALDDAEEWITRSGGIPEGYITDVLNNLRKKIDK